MEALIQRKQELTENEIIDRIIKGEKHLYEQVIRKYNPRLYRIGMSIINDEMETEEQMQNAFVKAYEKLGSFEHRSAFGTWLIRIFINECYQHLKNRKRDNELREQPVISVNYNNINEMKAPDRLLLNKELGKALEHALTELPEKYRTVFVMREVEEMSTADTMAALNLSESNVKVRLNRAKSMLRDSLSSFYKNDKIYSFHLVRCDRIVNNVMAKLAII
jgi:RNA polymerase sigma factor (sigma-70 family)